MLHGVLEKQILSSTSGVAYSSTGSLAGLTRAKTDLPAASALTAKENKEKTKSLKKEGHTQKKVKMTMAL